MYITKKINIVHISSQSGSSIVNSDQELWCFCLWLKTAGQKTVQVERGYFWSIPVFLQWLKTAGKNMVYEWFKCGYFWFITVFCLWLKTAGRKMVHEWFKCDYFWSITVFCLRLKTLGQDILQVVLE